MADHNHPPTDGDAALHGHQPDQVQIGTIVWFGVGLTVSVILVFVVIWFLLMYFQGRDIRTSKEIPPMMQVADPALYPAPRLQEHPNRNFAEYRAEVAAKANGYGWVNREAGVAHIPIERALEIVAESKRLKSATPGAAATDSVEAEPNPDLGPDGTDQPAPTEPGEPQPGARVPQ